MKYLLLPLFLLLTLFSIGQRDSVVAYYNDSTPKVRMFPDSHHETYYPSGELMSWSTRKWDSCMNLRIPYGIEYYRSGNVKSKSFFLPNRFVALVGYEDEESLKVTGGRMHHNKSKFYFKNNQLASITSERKKIPIQAPYEPPADPKHPNPRRVKYVYEEDAIPQLEGKYRMKSMVRGKCVAKGQFSYFELQNGFIYYYDESGELDLTEKVVNGVIQYNPKVEFEQKELERVVVGYYDRNFNGYAEKREVEKVEWFRLSLPESELRNFLWTEVFLFKKLKEIVVNDRLYEMNKFTNAEELKLAVLFNEGKLLAQNGHISLPPPAPKPNPKPAFISYPDSMASFNGGAVALQNWLSMNLNYPEQSKNAGNQGIVYLEFLVMKNGSIEDVKIVRGVDPFINREAKRLVAQMPNWKPAIYKNEIVVSKVRVPIRFVLD